MDLALTSSDEKEIQIACAGVVSQADIPLNTDPLGEVIGEGGYSRTVYLNLSLTHFIDSSGMAWLLSRHKKCAAEGGKLVLHSIPPLVRQMFELLKLQKVF